MRKLRYIGLLALAGASALAVFCKRKHKLHEEGLRKYGDKFYEYFQLLNRWIIARNEKKQIADYLREQNINKIAIYGMGELANRLYEELAGGDIQVLYGIDRDVCCTNSSIADIYYPDDVLPEVDAVVITPFLSAEGIAKDLSSRCPYRMIPLDNIIYSL